MTVHSLDEHRLALGLKWLVPGAIPAGAGAGRKARELASMKPPPVGFVQLETARRHAARRHRRPRRYRSAECSGVACQGATFGGSGRTTG